MTSTPQEHVNWTTVGSNTAAQNTYASIRQVLKELASRRSLDIFLQGSYANATNIRADSDVDIVIMTRAVFQGARERLASSYKSAYDSLPSGTFTLADLRTEVTSALTRHYGSRRVQPRNKCIKVEGTSGYVDADVVPALEYRWYRYQDSLSDYTAGILIDPLNGSPIVNYPKEHIKNGQTKNSQCATRYKETVRQVKRLRNRAVGEGRLREGVAPGYLLECMVYNVPPSEFLAGDSGRLSEVVLHLKFADKSNYRSCDGIHYLFKTDPGQFSVTTAQSIVDALWDAY